MPLSTYPVRPIRYIVASAIGGAPEHFEAFVRNEIRKWAEVVKRTSVKMD